jgi:hypothetical protein
MTAPRRYRQLASGSRLFGFELEAPEHTLVRPSDACARVTEERDGTQAGELEVVMFEAALLIDRDGILQDKLDDAARSLGEPQLRIGAPSAVELPGCGGYRADAEIARRMGAPRPPLPYIQLFALAAHDLRLNGGLVVTVRSASPHWPVADAVLGSLRMLDRAGKVAKGTSRGAALPIVGERDD